MTRYGSSKNGWTDQELFHGWLKEHFLTHAVQGHPLLLLVDGHSSHYDPATIRFAKEHSIVTRCQLLQFSEKVLERSLPRFLPVNNWKGYHQV